MRSYIYGFQIVPGCDNTLGFATSLDEAVKEVRASRLDVMADDPAQEVKASAIYEISVKDITLEDLVSVLNKRSSLANIVLGERKLVQNIGGQI